MISYNVSIVKEVEYSDPRAQRCSTFSPQTKDASRTPSGVDQTFVCVASRYRASCRCAWRVFLEDIEREALFLIDKMRNCPGIFQTSIESLV